MVERNDEEEKENQFRINICNDGENANKSER